MLRIVLLEKKLSLEAMIVLSEYSSRRRTVIQGISTTRSECSGKRSALKYLVRMLIVHRVFSVAFTPDTRYLLSGSDDGNVRLWRAEASSRAQVRSARERMKLEYDTALKDRYKHMPEVRRIARHRHIPKVIKKDGETKKFELASIARKEENRRKNTKEKKRRIPEREKHLVAVQK